MKAIQMRYLILGCLLTAIVAAPAHADEFAGTLSVSSVGEHSCIAVRLDVAPGTAMTGIEWFHNDENTTYPEVLIVEGTVNAPPDLMDTSLVLESLSGESLAWSSATFDSPVTSNAEAVYAVFVLPPYAERTGEGLDGGPGIGYKIVSGGQRTYLSPDGASWVRLRDTISLGVEVTAGMGKGLQTPVDLAQLKGSRPSGWWDEVALAVAEEPVREKVKVPEFRLSAYPNPFNPNTTIEYSLETAGDISIDVFDTRGRLVRMLYRGTQSAGPHSVAWNGTDERGSSVSSGVYHIQLHASKTTLSRRVVLVQ